MFIGELRIMLSIIKNDLKMLWGNKAALACLLFVPPILILVFSKIMVPVFGINTFIKPFSIAIVDYDNSMGSRMAISSLETKGYISDLVSTIQIEESEARKQLKDGYISAVVIIPQGFATSLYEGSNRSLSVYVNSRQGTNSELAKSFFMSAGDMVTAGQSGIYTIYHMLVKTGIGHEESYKKTQDAMNKLVLMSMGRNEVFEKSVVTDMPQISPTQYYIVGISVMFMMLSGVAGVRLMTHDYEAGTMARILISPLSILKYILAKLTTIVAIGLLEFISILLPFTIIFETGFSIANLPVLLIVLAVILSSSAFCILVTAWVKNSSYATIACVICIFIICLVGGCIFPVASMSEMLKLTSNLMLSKWAVQGVAMALTGGELINILSICGITLIFGLVFIVAAVLAFARREWRFI